MPTREFHAKRWKVTSAFVIMVLVFTFGLWKVQHDSASIAQLQHTNCSLKKFLTTAERARERAARHEQGGLRDTDLRAARGYHVLAANFNDGAIGEHCHVAALAAP